MARGRVPRLVAGRTVALELVAGALQWGWVIPAIRYFVVAGRALALAFCAITLVPASKSPQTHAQGDDALHRCLHHDETSLH